MTKSERKLLSLFNKAEASTSREESKKLIVKADKLHAKLIASMPSDNAD